MYNEYSALFFSCMNICNCTIAVNSMSQSLQKRIQGLLGGFNNFGNNASFPCTAPLQSLGDAVHSLGSGIPWLIIEQSVSFNFQRLGDFDKYRQAHLCIGVLNMTHMSRRNIDLLCKLLL